MYCPDCPSGLISLLSAQHHFPSTTLFLMKMNYPIVSLDFRGIGGHGSDFEGGCHPGVIEGLILTT